MQLTPWKLPHRTTPLKLPHGTYILEGKSCKIHQGSYIMERTRLKLPHGTYTIDTS